MIVRPSRPNSALPGRAVKPLFRLDQAGDSSVAFFFTRGRGPIPTLLHRLAGEAEAAPRVLSFVTQFGGGKTHTLAAQWHLAGIGEQAATLPGVADLLARERLPSVPKARLAVFVRNAWDPHAGRPTRRRTQWP
jgi:hypothetical protein